jgi:hypothetical protein
MATIWRGGCIIRARFLNRIRDAYAEHGDVENLLMVPYFTDAVANAQDAWRRVVTVATEQGVAIPAFSSSPVVLRRLPPRARPGEPDPGPARLLRRAHLPAHRRRGLLATPRGARTAPRRCRGRAAAQRGERLDLDPAGWRGVEEPDARHRTGRVAPGPRRRSASEETRASRSIRTGNGRWRSKAPLTGRGVAELASKVVCGERDAVAGFAEVDNPVVRDAASAYSSRLIVRSIRSEPVETTSTASTTSEARRTPPSSRRRARPARVTTTMSGRRTVPGRAGGPAAGRCRCR